VAGLTGRVGRALAAARRHWRLAAALLLALLALTGPPGLGAAERQSERVLASAAVAYASLRAINAGLSVAKETSIGVEVLGSVEGKPAMVLDPVDETVARISSAVFALAAASALLALGLAPAAQAGAWLAAAALAGLWAAERPRLAAPPALTRALRAAALFGVVFAVVLPVGYATGGWLGERATAARLDRALATLAQQEAEVDREITALAEEAGAPPPDLAEPPAPPPRDGEGEVMDRIFGNVSDLAQSVTSAGEGLVDRVRRQMESARERVPRMETVQARGAAIAHSGLDIIAVYMLRLVVFPVLTLGLLWVVLRALLRGG